MDKNSRHVAVVLGGTVPHAEVIRQLKARGYYTVLVDYFLNPPAAAEADVHCRDSAMDYDAVFRIAKKYHAELVLSSCLDQQINIAMRVAEELGLPHPFSSETAMKVTDKRLMKKIMVENDIPTARYRLVEGDVDLSALDLRFPLMVKPSDSCGSAGVCRLDSDDKDAFDKAVKDASQFGLSGSVLVEEFITGTEMSVHGYIENGTVKLLFGTCKIISTARGIAEELSNVYVPNLRPSLREKLEKIASQIAKAFDLPPYTPFFMQVIVRDEDVYVIEFSPRVAGGISSEVAKVYSGFDLIAYSIDSYLGTYEARSKRDLDKYVCCFSIYVENGIFDHITGAEALKADGTIRREILLKTKGDAVNWSKPSSARVMKYLIDAQDAEECYQKVKKADEATDIIDSDGNSMRSGKTMLTHELFMERLNTLI